MALPERPQLLVSLAPVLGVVLVVMVYRATYESEQGLYAGSEPALAGALVAAPFLVLALAQIGCALAATLAGSTRLRTALACLACLVTGVGAVGACVVLTW